MNKNIEKATDLLIKNFILDEAQPMESITQAFECINDCEKSKAYLGEAFFIAMVKLNIAKLKTQKLIMNGELH